MFICHLGYRANQHDVAYDVLYLIVIYHIINSSSSNKMRPKK
jgi:hypothetical protein